jgi:hypothetical protein
LIFKICPLHHPRPPVLCDDGHQGIFRHHCQAPRRAGVHRQRPRRDVHQHAVEGIVSAHRHLALHKLCFPSPVGRPVRGHQQNYHGVPALLGGQQATFVAPLATVGRVLLQLLPDNFEGNVVRSRVWPRAPPLFPYQAGMTRVVAVYRQLRDRDEFLIEIKDRLLQSQALMKQAHDQRRRDMEFAVDDWVWLRLNQRAATSVRGAGPSKLSAKFFGPYQVTAKIGSVSYRLQLPPNAKIHNVFHVVFLKKFEGSPPTHTP